MKVICNVEPFDLYQQVYIANDSGNRFNTPAQVSIQDLPAFIPQYCYSNDIYNVTFIGNVDYINGLIKQPIEELIAAEYSEHKNIEIEVLEQAWENI